MTDKENIQNLQEGEKFIVGESDYGKAEIHRLKFNYVLYEIPIYGGQPQFVRMFALNEINEMLQVVESWT